MEHDDHLIIAQRAHRVAGVVTKASTPVVVGNSHPFDVESYSHCHMSAIDVQTQTAWQNAAPTWTAIVLDPLRSLAKQEPEMGCYRVYPPKYSPPPNQCPDGSINPDPTSRTVRWGLTYHRYYQLPITYFLSSLGSDLLSTMTRNNLWIRVLSSTSTLEPDNRHRVPERIKKVNDKLHALDTTIPLHSQSAPHQARGGGGGGGGAGGMGLGAAIGAGFAGGRGAGAGKRSAMVEELDKGSVAASEIAIEQCKGHSTQLVKHLIFAITRAQQQQQPLSSTSADHSDSSHQPQQRASSVDDNARDDEHKRMDVG